MIDLSGLVFISVSALECDVLRKLRFAGNEDTGTVLSSCQGIMDEPMEKEGEYIQTMNNNGRGSGLMLIIVLLVALLIAWFAVTHMGGLGFGKTDAQQAQTQQNVIEQAQNAVDAINNRMQQAQELEP